MFFAPTERFAMPTNDVVSGSTSGTAGALSGLINQQFRLAARPVGLPKPGDWQRTEEAVRAPAEGEIVVRILYLSLDPAMRGWMREGRSYIPPVQIGEVMRAGVLGEVVGSRHDGFPVGAFVSATTGVQEYALSDGEGVRQVDGDAAPLPTYLGTLGMTGLTAYFGLLDVGRPEAGQTVVVSGAAGATGSVAGQIAKLKGCRVVGIAGGEDKCRTVVEEFGYDACLDYKAGDLKAGLRREAPDRIDVYFDNVGGEVLDTVLPGLARHGRSCCAVRSASTTPTPLPSGPGTTWRCWSTARAWRGSWSSTTPTATGRPCGT